MGEEQGGARLNFHIFFLYLKTKLENFNNHMKCIYTLFLLFLLFQVRLEGTSKIYAK